jgi:3-oxoacyl-[acyl-carrier protein] reductase
LSFTDQTAVVTGGTRGLGRAISLAFLAGWARVRAVYRGNDEAAAALKETAAELDGEAAERLTLDRLDVRDPASVAAYWQRLEGECPDGVQVLVNNAGIRRDRLLALMSPEDWSAVLDTNLTSGFLMSREAV